MQDTNTPTKTLLVAANPNPQSLTVSAAEKTRQALEQAKRPHTFVHLDECSFSPLLTAEEIHRRFSFDKETLRFQKELQETCLLGLFYPDWFGLPPALLVGWLQRVFAPGIAFEYEGEEFMKKKKKPLLSRLKVFLAISTDESESGSRSLRLGIEALQEKVFSYCGAITVLSEILYESHDAGNRARQAWMKTCSEQCLRLGKQ